MVATSLNIADGAKIDDLGGLAHANHYIWFAHVINVLKVFEIRVFSGNALCASVCK